MSRTVLLSRRKETKGRWASVVSVFWNGTDETGGFEVVVRIGAGERNSVTLPASKVRTVYETSIETIKETFADDIPQFRPRVRRLVRSAKRDIRRLRSQLPVDPNAKREPWLSR